MGRLIIRNGTVITASETIAADVLVEGERIAAIGHNLPAEGAEVLDATGKLLLPGGVDPHTHFDLPMFGTVASDDHYTGHKAAAFGGTTTVMDFVPQDEGQSLLDAFEGWQRKADKAAIDYSFHSNLSWIGEKTLAELPKLSAAGITSVKVFTAYNKRMRLQDGEIFRVMRVCAEHGLLPMLHAENGDVIEIMVAEAVEAGRLAPEWHAFTRPAWGEAEATYRGIALAAMVGAPLYIVHMTCVGALEAVCRALNKAAGDGRDVPAVPVLYDG
jgi:dihydropyrimidinase